MGEGRGRVARALIQRIHAAHMACDEAVKYVLLAGGRMLPLTRNRIMQAALLQHEGAGLSTAPYHRILRVFGPCLLTVHVCWYVLGTSHRL